MGPFRQLPSASYVLRAAQPETIAMPTKTRDAVRELLSTAAKEAWQDRRGEFRFAFFRPVSIQAGGQTYSAFSRDISLSAIGLLHSMELPVGEIEIVVPTESGRSAKLRAHIGRCDSCGQGWYISGGEFVNPRAGFQNPAGA
jgi:PilZ domain